MVNTWFIQQVEAESPGAGGRANQTQNSSLAKPPGSRVELEVREWEMCRGGGVWGDAHGKGRRVRDLK